MRKELKGLRTSFFQHMQTLILSVSIFSIFCFIGYIIFGPNGLSYILPITFGLIIYSYYYSAQLGPKIYGAIPIERHDAIYLYSILDRLTYMTGISDRTKIYLIPDRFEMNAFSTGDMGNPVIALSSRLIDSMNEKEIQAILAHEISHIIHGDSKWLVMSHILTKLLTGLNTLVQVMVIINIPLIIAGVLKFNPGVLVLVFFAPSIALLLHLKLSRLREYAADRTAVKITKDPDGLISALSKVEYFNRYKLGLMHKLYQNKYPELLQTHPNLEHRIENIRQVATNEL